MTDTSAPSATGEPTDVLVNFVLDKSGSMDPLAASTIEGFNAFLDEQRAGAGKALLSLTLFDTGFDVRYVAADLREVPPLGARGNRYQPAGGTALLDAVATTIKGTDAWLAGHHAEFSGDVICVIQTDGEENSSTTTNLDEVNALISAKTAEGWEFVFLGTGTAAWTEGQKFSAIPQDARFAADADPLSNRAAYASVSRGMTSKRAHGGRYADSLRAEGLPEEATEPRP